MQEGQELQDIELSPCKRKRYSQEDYINDEKINVIQYLIHFLKFILLMTKNIQLNHLKKKS